MQEILDIVGLERCLVRDLYTYTWKKGHKMNVTVLLFLVPVYQMP